MKTIFINAYGQGNMYALKEYYDRHHSKDYQIIFKDSKIINQRPIKRIVGRLIDYSRKYDMVISDNPFRLFSRGKHSLFISHGYGTKRTPGKEDLINPKTMAVCDSVRENVDYIVTMSKRDEDYFFRYDSETVTRYPAYTPLGLPRIDSMFDTEHNKKIAKRIRKTYKLGDKKIVLYCPTWRNYDTTAHVSKMYKDMEKLNEYLVEKNWQMIYRPHHLNPLLEKERLEGFSNIMEINSDEAPDVQEFLVTADVLLTDYSSIYLDYLVMNKPILFYTFDLEQYEEERGLEIDFNNDIETPGKKIQSLLDIPEILNNLTLNKDDFSSNRQEARQLFYEYLDGKSCERIWQLVDELLG